MIYKSNIYIFVIAVISILSALGITLFYYWHFPELSGKHGAWGEFGSFIGGVLSSIFGFFGLIAILITISIQGRQLDISSEELRLTRAELELSRKAQQETAAALKSQLEYAVISSKLSALQIDLSICQNEINTYYDFMMRVEKINTTRKEKGEEMIKAQDLVGVDGYKDIYKKFSEDFKRKQEIHKEIISINQKLIC